MKNAFFASIAALCTLLFLVSSAQAQSSTPVPDGTETAVVDAIGKLSPAQRDEFRQQLLSIAQAMGAEPVPAAAAPAANGLATAPAATPAPAAPKVSMPEVADKALDMFKGLVVSISSTLEKVAPQVWRIMIKQQYAMAVGELIVPFTLLAACITYWLVSRKMWVLKEDASSEMETAHLLLTKVGPYVGIFIFLIWSANAFSDSAKYLINPEYYAVRDILTMLASPMGAVR